MDSAGSFVDHANTVFKRLLKADQQYRGENDPRREQS